MSEFKALPAERTSDSDDSPKTPDNAADRDRTPAGVEVAGLHPAFVSPSTPSANHKRAATGPVPVVDLDGALAVDIRSARGGSRGSNGNQPVAGGDDILNEAEMSAASMNIDAPPFPLELRFEDLSYFVQQIAGPKDEKERQVLFGVNGLVKPGELLAIMGPTGAGKSSLLNILAGQTKTGIIRGRVMYNDRPRTKMMKRWSAYVLQDDTFFSQLTVRETLTFSAMVRLPSAIPKAEKLRQVHRVIKMLNLEKCQHTIVGGPFMRGISGGERRRLNIGNEILNNPSLLLCDEPTSGLDSSTAHTVLQTLVGLARSGRSVVVTIHQPSSRMFAKFDKLLLLAQGKTIYYGPANKVTSYLAMQGYPAPSHYNPADFILELVTEEELAGGAPKIDALANAYIEFAKQTNAYELPAVDRPLHGMKGEDLLVAASTAGAPPVLEIEMGDMSRRVSAADSAPVEVAIEQPPLVSPMSLPLEAAASTSEERWATTFWEQLVALTIRSYKQQRGERITGLYFWQYLSLALIVGLIWFQIPNTEGSLQDKTGYLFFEAIFWSMNGIFNSLTNFPAERAVLMKERASGSYRVSAYFIAKTTSEIPVEMIYPTIYVIISYWMAGLAANGGKFLANWLTIVLSMLTAQSVGLTISAAVMDFKKSIVVASVGMLGLMLISGFYVNGNNLPVWIKWVQYLAFMKYSYAVVAQIEFTGLNVACATSASSFTQCIGNPSGTIPGDAVLAFYDLNSLSVGANVGILFAFLFGFRFFAYFFLRRNK